MTSKVIHAIAECLHCGKQFQNYTTARAEARKHAKQTGHRVHGEQAIAFSYGGKRKKKP